MSKETDEAFEKWVKKNNFAYSRSGSDITINELSVRRLFAKVAALEELARLVRLTFPDTRDFFIHRSGTVEERALVTYLRALTPPEPKEPTADAEELDAERMEDEWRARAGGR